MLLWDAVGYIQDKEEWRTFFRTSVLGSVGIGGWKMTVGGKNCSVSGISYGSAQVCAGSRVLQSLFIHTYLLYTSKPTLA